MSDGIKLSKKYGLNPTIPICFWCGKERGEIALMGHIGDGRKHEDFEAPKQMVIDLEPCDECKKNMALGVTVIEATNTPNNACGIEMQKGAYPTGRFVVMKTDAARRTFGSLIDGVDKAFIDVDGFTQLFGREVVL